MHLQDIENPLFAIKEVLEEIGKNNPIAIKSLAIFHLNESKMTEVQFSE